MRDPALAPLTASDISGEIWQEMARQRPGDSTPKRVRPPAARAGSPPPLPLEELLALDGRPFLEAAYWTLLGRAIDDVGAAYASGQLANGISKVEILYQLQASAEGQRAGRGFPGLRNRYIAHRVYRLPAVGRLARLGAVALRQTGLLAGLGKLGPPGLNQRWRSLEQSHQAMQQALAEQGRLLQAMSDRISQTGRQLTAVEDTVIEAVLGLAGQVAGHEKLLANELAMADRAAAAARIDQAAGALRLALETRVIAAENLVQQNQRVVLDQQRRIGLMLQAMRHPVPAAAEAQDDHALDALYVAFEDRFRGARSDIMDRQRVYLPRLRDAGAGADDRPVLDIGAGRGEFLELLRQEGLRALGVDLNASMAEACRAIGLDCTQGDALLFLAAQADNSLGAITGFHIIEHLPFKVMVRIMDEALRVLAPGGLLILETPNPANLLTASRYFYLDPTHRNPLPHEMVAMIAEMRGFTSPEVLHLHPMQDRLPGADRVLAGALEGMFYGPQDYALIARKH